MALGNTFFLKGVLGHRWGLGSFRGYFFSWFFPFFNYLSLFGLFRKAVGRGEGLGRDVLLGSVFVGAVSALELEWPDAQMAEG